LAKRDGPRRKGETRIPTPSRSSRIVRFLARLRGDTLYWESLFFALSFLLGSALTRSRIDRIYAPEPMVMKVLSRLRFLLPGRPELLFLHGVWMNPDDYLPFADRIQEVSVVNHARAVTSCPDKPVALIPHFLADENELPSSDFRRRHALGNRKILLNVGILNREHKRTDHLLREAASLPESWMVVVCGGVGDPAILEKGRALLGDRFRHLTLAKEEMAEAYRNANLFVHCATTEGFGLVIIEAMRGGLPVLVHDGELFRWIVKDADQCIDMTQSGVLRAHLETLTTDPKRRDERGKRNLETFERNYTWQAVREAYFRFLFA
jgi:glycosyltransferase involved in cell wall biosynthesis